MRFVTSIVTLLLWTSCYLHCSAERFEGDAYVVKTTAFGDCPCPGETPNEDSSNCDDSEFVLLGGKTKAPEQSIDFGKNIPISEAGFLTTLLTLFAQSDSADLPPPDLLLAPDDHDRASVARPIRGPSV